MLELVYDSTLTDTINSRSCLKCREHKLKCDRHQPCLPCRRKQRECRFPDQPRSTKKRPRSASLEQEKDVSDVMQSQISREQRSTMDDLPSTAYHLGPASDLEQTINPPNSHRFSRSTSFTQEVAASLHQWPDDQVINLFDPDELWQSMFDFDNVELDDASFSHTQEAIWPMSLDIQLVHRLIDVYISQIHPSIPICIPSKIKEGLASLRYVTDREFAAQILATCAFMCLQAPPPNKSMNLAKQFLSEAVRLYKIETLGETPTVEGALACFQIFGCLWTMGSDNAAWLRLQETINLARLLHLEDLDSKDIEETIDWLSKVHLYLGLIIVERAFAAGRDHRLLTKLPSEILLNRLASFSSRLSIQDQRHAAALRLLVRSFGCLDDDLLVCWRNKCERATNQGSCTRLERDKMVKIFTAFPTSESPEWKYLLGRKIFRLQEETETGYDFTTNEHGDVLLTCLWLQNRLWHLALTHGLLSFHESFEVLRLSFAERLAEQALTICKAFRISSFEGHGQGLAEKVYNIASDFLDVAQWSHSQNRIHQNPSYHAEEAIPPGPPILRESIDAATTPKTIHSTGVNHETIPHPKPARTRIDIATGLLGFLALFNNGQNSRFREYMESYQRFYNYEVQNSWE